VSDPDTIFAPASGAGLAAIAIMRLSGPATAAVLARLAGAPPPPRRASLRRLRGPDGETLDHAMVLWFPAPASYTGEDAAELHLHGGRAVTEAVAAALLAAGARPAEPGEFTRRAFLNGKLDLLAAEAVADLVEAETEAQRRQALRQLEGALGDLCRGWADRLLTLMAREEALIDFPDEDLPQALAAEAEAARAALAAELTAHLDDAHRGERLREGLVFAVTGPPNVGKSSLVNALAEREVAIVSPHPGTTRDALETRLILGGVPVTLVDTAGLREAADPIEAEGIRRARAHAAAADLVLALAEAGSNAPITPGTLAIATKTDLGGAVPPGALGISTRTGAGLEALRARLAAEATRLTAAAGPPPLTRARHRAALTAARDALVAAGSAPAPELRAEELRQALRALGRITGTVDAETVLGAIFSRFCIGK
jgi:tRNA modification GTPase